MPAEVETMAYAGATPWHGLGTALEAADSYDWPRVCEKANLAWDVELVALLTADTQAKVESKAVRRTSDGRILGVVGPRYTVLQNRDAFAWFQPLARGGSPNEHEPSREGTGARAHPLDDPPRHAGGAAGRTGESG
jgi:hypothetical protein